MGQPRVVLDGLTDLKPVRIAHPVIEEGEVGRCIADLLERTATVLREPDVVAGRAEDIGNHPAHRSVVVR
jgi:hypothetical protein